MFETSQEEPSGHDTKVVGGVIIAVMAVLGILYYIYVRPATTTTQTAQGSETTAAAAEAAGPADPMRDLQIASFNLGRDSTQTMAMWNLQLANRSTVYAYNNIRYSTNYYDAQGTLLYHNEGTISEQLNPGETRSIDQINDGLYPVGTARYTIEILGADTVQQ